MNFTKLHDFLAQHIPAGQVPGCDILVYHKDDIVYREQFGTGDYTHTAPVDPDAYYFLYSCTKIVTCAAVMHLIEDGKLGLDDPVSDYLPSFTDLDRRGGGKIRSTVTVRHLMSMTGGLDYDLGAHQLREMLRHDPDADTVAIATAIGRKPLYFEPGSHYQYSLCHDVLAAVAEIVTGMTFHDYVKSWAFDPLGLTHIGFRVTEENRIHMAPQFHVLPDGRTWPTALRNEFILSPNHDSGGAGLIATAEDYTAVLNALVTGKLLKRKTLELMTTNQLNDEALADLHQSKEKQAYGYGLGVRTLMFPEKINHTAPMREFGWTGAAGSYAMLDYERQIAVGYFQHVRNCTDTSVIHAGIRDRVYECLGYSFK